MNTFIISLTCFSLAWVAVYFFYHNAVRPVLLTKVKYRLFELRDELRLLAAFDELPKDHRVGAYPIVERHLNRAIGAIDSIDFADVFTTPYDKEADLRIRNDASLVLSSDPKLQSIFKRSMNHLMAAIILNSPIFFFIVPFVVSVSMYVSAVREWSEWVERRAWQTADVFGKPGRVPCV